MNNNWHIHVCLSIKKKKSLAVQTRFTCSRIPSPPHSLLISVFLFYGGFAQGPLLHHRVWERSTIAGAIVQFVEPRQCLDAAWRPTWAHLVACSFGGAQRPSRAGFKARRPGGPGWSPRTRPVASGLSRTRGPASSSGLAETLLLLGALWCLRTPHSNGLGVKFVLGVLHLARHGLD